MTYVKCQNIPELGVIPLPGRCCPCTPLWMKTLRLGQTKRIESMAVWIEIVKQEVAIGFFVLPTYFCFANSFLSSKFLLQLLQAYIF